MTPEYWIYLDYLAPGKTLFLALTRILDANAREYVDIVPANIMEWQKNAKL